MKSRTIKDMYNHFLKKGFQKPTKEFVTGEEYDCWRTERFKRLVDKESNKMKAIIIREISFE